MRSLCTVLMVAFAALPAGAIIVDRVAVAVGNKVITESEIALRIRLTAFQNGEAPDLSLKSRQQATARLIDQKLIVREMEVGRYPALSAERSRELLDDFLKQNFDGDATSMALAVTEYALLPEDLQEDLTRQADLLTFLGLRFRPAVQVSDQEIRKYFEEKSSGVKSEENFNSLRASIERLLAADLADRDLDVWLSDQKKRTRIIYVQGELAGDGSR